MRSLPLLGSPWDLLSSSLTVARHLEMTKKEGCVQNVKLHIVSSGLCWEPLDWHSIWIVFPSALTPGPRVKSHPALSPDGMASTQPVPSPAVPRQSGE